MLSGLDYAVQQNFALPCRPYRLKLSSKMATEVDLTEVLAAVDISASTTEDTTPRKWVEAW